eukprot:TRINITY_DN7790_c0_g2_i3.p2 TRINITY_DN7790_c0_g2~~TRINITY_DN7790_c0_g2_i3.p2  ORF type:complete len:160 (-),score=23.29 TRINITY_DN7790_c0_g2_i3:534-956(-)
MCIRDRYQRRVHGDHLFIKSNFISLSFIYFQTMNDKKVPKSPGSQRPANKPPRKRRGNPRRLVFPSVQELTQKNAIMATTFTESSTLGDLIPRFGNGFVTQSEQEIRMPSMPPPDAPRTARVFPQPAPFILQERQRTLRL